MGGKFQDQGHIYQDLEEWFYPRGVQPDLDFLSDEEKQESIWVEYPTPEVAIINNQAPEGGTSTMVVFKWSENL